MGVKLSNHCLILLLHNTLPHVPPLGNSTSPQVLRFHGYFQQRVLHSPDEEYRVRPVVLFYYLEDDSMCVMEPLVENSGLPQGKLIKRQQLPRKDRSVPYHWKDLNLALDLEVYGVLYRITNCDSFTRVKPLNIQDSSAFGCLFLAFCLKLSVCLSLCHSHCLSHRSICLSVHLSNL